MKKILVVDDEKIMTSVIYAILSDLHHVAVTNNGVEALELIRGYKLFDVVIVDLVMPKVSGKEVIAAAKEKNIPHIIIMSGVHKDAQEIAMAEGVSFILKPFKPDQIIEMVNGT